MAPTNRERRAAKKRRRDATRPAGRDTDPGLAMETLQAVLRRTAADLAADPVAGEGALTEMRHVLAEHLARRRERVLAACDSVLAEASPSTDGSGLAAELAAGGTASSWAERTRARTEEVAVATVRLLALT